MSDDFELTEEQLALADKLNHRQFKFVCNLIMGLPKYKAYQEAGFDVNLQTAAANANEALKIPKVLKFYNSLKETQIKRIAKMAILTRERALEILTDIAETDMNDVLEFKDVEIETSEGRTELRTIFHAKTDEDGKLIKGKSTKSVTFTKQGPKIEVEDRQRAIAQIGKMEGWDKSSDRDKDANNAQVEAFKQWSGAGVIGVSQNEEENSEED